MRLAKLNLRFRRLARPLAREGLALDILKLAVGTSAAQVINIISLPMLSRLYAPEVFGSFGLFNTLVTILAVVGCLRYEYAIMLPSSDEEAANVFAIAAAVPLGFAVVTAVIIAAAGDWITAVLHAPALRALLWLLPISLALAGVYAALNFWVSRNKQFGQVAGAAVSAAATSSAAQIAAGAAGQPTPAALIAGGMLGTAIAAGVLAVQMWRSGGGLLKSAIRPRRVWQVAVRFRKFPLVDSWGGFVSNLGWQLPVLLLSVFFNQSVVGSYAMAFQTIQLPLALVGSSIGRVFFQRASAVRHDQNALRAVVLAVFERLVALMLFPAILLTVVGQDFTIVLLGKEWAAAGYYAQIFGLWTIVWFVSQPLLTLFAVQEKQGRALAVHSAILVTRTAALLIGGRAQSIELTLWLFTGSGIVIHGGMLLWIMRLSGVQFRAVLDVLWRYGRYGIVLALALLAIKAASAYSILIVIASAVSAAVCFLWMVRGSFRTMGLRLT